MLTRFKIDTIEVLDNVFFEKVSLSGIFGVNREVFLHFRYAIVQKLKVKRGE